jgi:hypothetical protein
MIEWLGGIDAFNQTSSMWRRFGIDSGVELSLLVVGYEIAEFCKQIGKTFELTSDSNEPDPNETGL